MDYSKIDGVIDYGTLKDYEFPNRKLGVIVHIEDEKGEILLQQRGVKSRDENGLYEDVGGKLEDGEEFREAIIREMREEMGREALISLSDPIGIFHCFKGGINWVFVIFFGWYKSGEIKIMEPDKCQGYEFFKYEEAIKSELVTECCKFLLKSIHDKHDF